MQDPFLLPAQETTNTKALRKTLSQLVTSNQHTFLGGERGELMHPRRRNECVPPLLLNAVDRLGRKIDPVVLSVAREIGPRALSYAQNLIGDPAAAINYLEEAAASVSAAMVQKKLSGRPEVRDVAAYLFRTFVRMVDDVRSKEATVEEAVEERGDLQTHWTGQDQVETAVLLSEVMATCDRASREVVVLRLEGFSWHEIGQHLGISTHAAELRFSKALDRARKTLKIPRRKG
jgi:DNA-directed RNA polymerase specialized sigma24 family protein